MARRYRSLFLEVPAPCPRPHFVVEKLSRPIPLFQNASKASLRWAVLCTVTGARFMATRSRREADLAARMYGEPQCWCCAERARPDGHIKEVK